MVDSVADLWLVGCLRVAKLYPRRQSCLHKQNQCMTCAMCKFNSLYMQLTDGWLSGWWMTDRLTDWLINRLTLANWLMIDWPTVISSSIDWVPDFCRLTYPAPDGVSPGTVVFEGCNLLLSSLPNHVKFWTANLTTLLWPNDLATFPIYFLTKADEKRLMNFLIRKIV